MWQFNPIKWFILQSKKCQKIVKTSRHSFPETQVTSLNCLFFFPPNAPNPKDINFIIFVKQEIAAILTFEKVEQGFMLDEFGKISVFQSYNYNNPQTN